MEIGVLILLVVGLIVGGFMEGTKIGRKFTVWSLKEFCDIDINDYEEE
jgi:hypothetical protein